MLKFSSSFYSNRCQNKLKLYIAPNWLKPAARTAGLLASESNQEPNDTEPCIKLI